MRENVCLRVDVDAIKNKILGVDVMWNLFHPSYFPGSPFILPIFTSTTSIGLFTDNAKLNLGNYNHDSQITNRTACDL